MTTDERTEEQLNVRFERALYEQLREHAARNERSIAQEVRYIIRCHLDGGGSRCEP